MLSASSCKSWDNQEKKKQHKEEMERMQFSVCPTSLAKLLSIRGKPLPHDSDHIQIDQLLKSTLLKHILV